MQIVEKEFERGLTQFTDVVIWSTLLPKKFGGDHAFWSNFSDFYEQNNKGHWAKDNKPHLGIARVLTFLKKHEKEASK